MRNWESLIINIISLILIPLSDLAISMTSVKNLVLTSLYSVNLIQSLLYLTNYYNNPLDKSIFYLSFCSLLIYTVSISFQLYGFNNKSHSEIIPLTPCPTPISIPSDIFTTRPQPYHQKSHTSITNSLNLSPVLTNLSKRSTDLLLFKIDDILSPHLAKQQQIQSVNDIPETNYINPPQPTLVTDNTQVPKLVSNPIKKTLKSAPIMATLLALSSPAPTNAAPISQLNNTISLVYNYNPVLNFVLSLSINLLNINLWMTPTSLHLFKLFLNAINWLMITMFALSLDSSILDIIVPIFDNKFQIMVNTSIVLFSIVLAIIIMRNKIRQSKISPNECFTDITTMTIQNYGSTTSLF